MTLKDFLDATGRRDRSHVRESIAALPDQCAQALADTSRVRLPILYRTADRVVLAGMGGSALGGHLVAAALTDDLRVPLVVVSDYTLPAWVNHRTLVICASYSGDTEETLAAYRHARALGAKLAAVTTGGALARAASRDGVPLVRIVPTHNPSGQPRLGLGYAVFGLIGILRRARLIRTKPAALETAIADLRAANARFDRSGAIPALARTVADRELVLLAAEHLSGATHAARNIIHETAKHLAIHFPLPEADHHLLEGLRFPRANARRLHALLLTSARYHERTQLRIRVTRDLLHRQRIDATVVPLAASSRLAEALSTVAWGSLLALTLARLHHVDAGQVPWVRELKRRLTRG